MDCLGVFGGRCEHVCLLQRVQEKHEVRVDAEDARGCMKGDSKWSRVAGLSVF